MASLENYDMGHLPIVYEMMGARRHPFDTSVDLDGNQEANSMQKNRSDTDAHTDCSFNVSRKRMQNTLTDTDAISGYLQSYCLFQFLPQATSHEPF